MSKKRRQPRTPVSPDEQTDSWAVFEPNNDPVKTMPELPNVTAGGIIIPDIELLRPLGT